MTNTVTQVQLLTLAINFWVSKIDISMKKIASEEGGVSFEISGIPNDLIEDLRKHYTSEGKNFSFNFGNKNLTLKWGHRPDNL